MKVKEIIFLVSIFFIHFSFANDSTYWTTHPQFKSDLKEILSLYQVNAQVKSVFKIAGDIHSFNPTIGELKKLKGSEHLFAGPLNLQPWLMKAKKASLFPLKTTLLNGGSDNQSHYWLDLDLALNIERQVIEKLSLWSQGFEGAKNYLWADKIKKHAHSIKDKLSKKGIKTVILGHNALENLMLQLNIKSLTLYKDSHHSSQNAEILKETIQLLHKLKSKNRIKEVIYIGGPSYPWPEHLKQYQITKVTWQAINDKVTPIQDLDKKLDKL